MQKRLAMLFENRGIGMFTGDVGCGKSTAIRAALQSLSTQTHKTVYLYRGLDELGAFYKQIAAQLGIMPMFRKSDIARQVITAIEELYTQQKITTILVIDEAHLLRADVLDEIRLIHNSNYDSADFIATALVGQPPLKKMMNYNKFLPLKQRLSVTCHIKALSKSDAYKYMEHQVALSKAANKIFMDNALETIITASKCVPRVINTVALKSMYRAAEQKMDTVDQECVMHALDELGMSCN
jgi:type II secretory pathway predicted ATPase ExeA